MKHILFGLNQNSDKKIENKILNKYKNITGKEFTFDSEFYLYGIEKALSEKNFDVLILREDLEANKQVPVKFLDSISDKYPQLNIILVVNNNHQADKYIIDIFSLGLYNILYREDLTLGNLASLIESPRTKLDAKIYLELEDVSEVQEKTNSVDDVMEIPDDELINIINSLKGATTANISEMFHEVDKQYEKEQMLFLVSLLPGEIKDIIRASNNEAFLGYEAHWKNKVEKADKKDKASSKRKERFKENKSKPEKVIIEKEKIVEVEKKIVEKVYIEKEKEVKVYERPNDYKKKTGFVGHKGAGTTSLICFIGDFLSQNKINTAIVDLTKSRDLYDIFLINEIENVEGESSKDFKESQALIPLVKGTIKPYKINKYLDLFTASFEKDIDINNPFYFIQLLEQEYDVILIDMDYETPKEVYQILNTVYIVQTLNLPKVKLNTSYQLSLMDKINMRKIKYIINQTIPCGMKVKDMVSCLKVFTNLDTFERTSLIDGDIKYFNVPSSKELMKMIYEMNYNFNKLDKEVLAAIKEIAVDIYPINIKDNEGIFGKLLKLFKKKKKIVIKDDSHKDLQATSISNSALKCDNNIRLNITQEPSKAIDEVVIIGNQASKVGPVKDKAKDINKVIEKEKEADLDLNYIEFDDEDIQAGNDEDTECIDNTLGDISTIDMDNFDFDLDIKEDI